MTNYSRQITVTAPLNMSENEKQLFTGSLTYRLDKIVIKRLKKAFVTYNGFCVDEGGLVKECHHWYPEQYDGYLKQVALYQDIVRKYREKLITLGDDHVCLLIHHPWYNYYHWLCESIFRLWLVRDQLGPMLLLLPDYYKTSDFINGSLEAFGCKNIFYIPAFSSLLVKNLCMPQIKPIVDSYDGTIVKQIKKFYLHHVLMEKQIHMDLGEKIYISRKKASRRKIDNEDELEPILSKYGFIIVQNEDYTFLQQVAIFSKAKYLISIHGSGLTNMIFMKENACILEFHKKKTNEKDWHSLAFWYLADCLDYRYYHQLCNPTDLQADYFRADMIVDLLKFEENIKQMLA